MEKTPKFSTFGERLNYWRLKRGFIKQTPFATKLGIKQPSLSELETDESKKPSAIVLLKAADALLLNPWYLLTGVGPVESVAYASLTQPEQQLIVMLRSLGDNALREHLDSANMDYAKLSAPDKSEKRAALRSPTSDYT